MLCTVYDMFKMLLKMYTKQTILFVIYFLFIIYIYVLTIFDL